MSIHWYTNRLFFWFQYQYSPHIIVLITAVVYTQNTLRSFKRGIRNKMCGCVQNLLHGSQRQRSYWMEKNSPEQFFCFVFFQSVHWQKCRIASSKISKSTSLSENEGGNTDNDLNWDKQYIASTLFKVYNIVCSSKLWLDGIPNKVYVKVKPTNTDANTNNYAQEFLWFNTKAVSQWMHFQSTAT